MVASSLLEFLILLFAGFLPLPVQWSIPPLPEDPKLLRAVPADSIAFAQWYGTAPANADSPNHTENLFAEPEIAHLHERLLAAIRAGITADAGAQTTVVNECIDLVLQTVSRPGCVFVGPIDVARPQRMSAGLVVRLDDQIAAATQTMRKLESVIAESRPTDAAAPGPVAADGVQFRPMSLGAGAPLITWAGIDGYLVVAIGEETPAKIVAGLRSGDGMSTQATFMALSKNTHVARPSTRSFIDVAAILEQLAPMIDDRGKRSLAALGLDRITGLYSIGGLEGDGFAMRSLLGMQPPAGDRDDLLQLFGTRPLDAADLAVVPADAEIAIAARLDPLAIRRSVVAIAEAFEPGASDDFEREVAGALTAATGLQLDKDLLEPLGDCVTVWSSPGQGSLVFSGATLAISIDDPARFGAAFDRLMGFVREATPRKEMQGGGRLRRGFYVEQMRVGEHTVHYLNMIGDDFWLAPAWCVADRHLLVSFFPQPIRATLKRGAVVESSFAQRAGLSDPPGAVAIACADTRSLFDKLYPLLHPLAHMLAAQAQRQGLPIDISALPTAGAIAPHLQPSQARLQHTAAGLQLTRLGSLPILDPLLGGVAPMLGLGAMFSYRAAVQVQMMREAELRRMEAERRRK